MLGPDQSGRSGIEMKADVRRPERKSRLRPGMARAQPCRYRQSAAMESIGVANTLGVVALLTEAAVVLRP